MPIEMSAEMIVILIVGVLLFLETRIDSHSEMDIQALRLLTNEIKRLDGEMKEMGLKVKDVNDYVNMMDDTVISTIRDEYAILEEIKEEFLSEKGNI